MISCIGITQHTEITEEYIEHEFCTSKQVVFVGPFSTSVEACQWMTYMLGRSQDTQQIALPGYFLDTSPWYGVAFNCKKKPNRHFCVKNELPMVHVSKT